MCVQETKVYIITNVAKLSSHSLLVHKPLSNSHLYVPPLPGPDLESVTQQQLIASIYTAHSFFVVHGVTSILFLSVLEQKEN